MGGIGPMGSSGPTPQQSLDDLMTQLSTLASGQSVSASQVASDIQNIRANIDSFPSGTFNSKFYVDLLSTGNNGLLNQLLNNLGNNPNSLLTCANAQAVLSEFTGDNGASILQNIETALNAIINNNYHGPGEQLVIDFMALGYLQPSGLSPAFEQDLSQLMAAGGSGTGTGLISNFIEGLEENPNSMAVQGMAQAILSQITGDNGASVLQNIETALNTIINNNYHGPEQQLVIDFMALGYLQPSGLSPAFQADLTSFMANPNGNSNIAQLLQSNSQSQMQALSQAILNEITGS
jgi:hypothetical protein